MAKIGTDPNIGKDTRFPIQDPTKGGRPKTRPLRDLLEKIETDDFIVTIPLSDCEINDEKGVVIIKIPSNEVMAMNLQKKALKDVRWFQEYAKVKGEYAPTKVSETDSKGNDILPPLFGDFGVVNLENEEKLTN